MTKIGFIGLGKLGLPVAAAMALKGADVMGYDIEKKRMSYGKQPYQETGPDGEGDFNDILAMMESITYGNLTFGSIQEVVNHAEIIFLAVQTPHDERFDGSKPLEDDPVDFDYTYLIEAVKSVVSISVTNPKILTVISTVLPGTMEREIKPLLTDDWKLCYNPAFIAMGTTMRDWLNSEFILLGVDDEDAARWVELYYRVVLPSVPIRRMSVPSAELTKIMYNTAISQKITLANTVMEICHKIPGANCDDVTKAMQSAYRRVTGPQYMSGGMGDGGGCHPRDNIAMMWFADKLCLSHNPFSPAMRGREKQSMWLRSLIFNHYRGQEIVIAGYAFKPGTNIIAGSPALLLYNQLRQDGWTVELCDPHVNEKDSWDKIKPKALIFLGCRHPEFKGKLDWPEGSTVIDPFRITPDQNGVTVIRIGA